MKKFLPLAVAAMLVAPAMAQAQTSVSCMYMLLKIYHTEMQVCRAPLTKVQEDRYTRLKASFETFIRANAKFDPEAMIASVDTNVKRALAGLKSCKSDDFASAKDAMGKMLTPENEASVNATLKYPQNPQAGSCGE